MKLYPNHYCENITTITPEFLKENNIQALVLDVDNTLLDFDLKIVDGLKEWHDVIRANGVKSIIVSNSNKLTKVKMVADLLEIPFIRFAMKPLKRGFKKAQKELGVPYENIAAVGDQIFTDVMGANSAKMFSILVKPLDKKDIWITRFKRPIEELVIKSYLKKAGK